MGNDIVAGIWDDTEIFSKYRVELSFTNEVMGGVPQNPEAIEGWLRQRVIGGDREVLHMMYKTLDDLGVDATDEMSREELVAAAKRLADEQHGNTFRRDENGLYLSHYQIKAALKECVNILYAGEKWGKTRKGPKGFVAERVFVDEHRIYLGRQERDGVHLQIGHVIGPQGPRNTMTYYDYADRPVVTFAVSSLMDCIEPKQWKEIFLTMQRNGIGALRSMGYGQFKVTAFEQVA